MPYYIIDGHASLAFADINDGLISQMPDKRELCTVRGLVTFAWRGFAVAYSGIGDIGLCAAQVNLISGGSIDVDRGRLTLSEQAIQEIDSRMTAASVKLSHDFLKEFHTSKFAMLNRKICHKYVYIQNDFPPPSSDDNWAEILPSGRRWSPITFPCADLLCQRYSRSIEEAEYKWSESAVRVLPLVQSEKHDVYSAGSALGGGTVVINASTGEPAILWHAGEQDPLPQYPRAAEFPAEWAGLLGLKSPNRLILNGGHKLVQMAQNAFTKPVADLRTIESEVVEASATASDAAKWIVRNCGRKEAFWNGLKDSFPLAYERLFRAVGMDEIIRMWHLSENYDESSFVTITSKGALGAKKRGQDIHFPDGLNLERPSEERWWIRRAP